MTESPSSTPEAAPRPASRTRTILMLVFGGIVLAVGGGALFASYLNIGGGGSSSSNEALSATGAIIFCGGVLLFIIGVIWAVARWIDRRFAKAGK